MLRRGGDLAEIAQVLRQSDLGTTSGYAKIDWAALRTVSGSGRGWHGERLRAARRGVPAAARALGHDLADAARLLPRFVAYLDATGVSSITIEAALAWA